MMSPVMWDQVKLYIHTVYKKNILIPLTIKMAISWIEQNTATFEEFFCGVHNGLEDFYMLNVLLKNFAYGYCFMK